jgi:hypothetical protein
MGRLRTPYLPQLQARLCVAAVFVGALVVVVGCASDPANSRPGVTLGELDPAVPPLPQLGPDPEEPVRPAVIHAIVQRIDIPLDEPTDDAWALINEQAFPAITRGMWQSNGLRLGLLEEDDVEPFATAMPQVLELFETQVYTSDHPVPIMATPRLRTGSRIPVDLSAPPAPPREDVITGGGDGKLQFLAQLEQTDGKVYLVLTPHHFLPDNNHLIPRDILERELDGRLFHELAVRVELRHDRLLVIGLFWPWPIEEQLDDNDPGRVPRPSVDLSWIAQTSIALDDDPAAPPSHLRLGVPERPESDEVPDEDAAEPDEDSATTPVRYARVAPPLPVHFGRALLTGTRARQPVQTLLLISIPAPDPDPTGSEPGDTVGE